MLGPIDVVPVADHPELAVLRRYPGLGDPVDQLLGAQAVGHQLGHRDEGQAVLPGHLVELRPAGHRAVRIQDLTDHAGGHPAREPRQVHAGLGLSHPLEHAAGPCAQREDVSRAAADQETTGARED